LGDGLFWILRPVGENQTQYSYGIVDEASKLNVNTATLDMIARLPGMTTEFAASIIDWRDTDTDVTSGGAESEYYLMLPDPYECKDGPLETVEELFLVRGATQEILFGQDVNRNGIIDPAESNIILSGTTSSTGARLDLGIINFVTVYSVEPGSSPAAAGSLTSGSLTSGSSTSGAATADQLVNVNDPQQSQALTSLLQQYVATNRLPGVLDRVRRERPFRSIIDFYYRAGLAIDEFQRFDDKVTTGLTDQQGLINVNTAPTEVLACLPQLDEGDVAALLVHRPTGTVDHPGIAWVTQALTREKAVAIGPYITAKSYQFSADIVSITSTGRAFKRCRVVVDARESPPKVIYRQNLSHLGWPLDPDIITSLRSGRGGLGTVQTIGREVGVR
jgi:type II secretory pathway component PulK